MSYIGEKWACDHTSSIDAFDMEVQSPMDQLQDLKLEIRAQVTEIEIKIKRAAMSPFQIIRSVLRVVQK